MHTLLAHSSRRDALIVLLAIAALIALATLAQAADSAGGACPPLAVANKWHYSLTPYVWLTSISGDVAAHGQTAHVDVSADEVIKHLNWITEVHIEARKDRVGFYIDPTYVKLSIGASANGNPAHVGFREWLIEFAGTYRVLKRTSAENASQSVDLIAGGRYWNLNTSVNVTGGGSGSGTRQWVDPIVGLRYTADLSPNWSFLLQGDIGGFGAASEFTWSVAPLAFYHLSANRSIVFGYRALGVDYSTGSGADLFKQDVTYHGPILGYEFTF